MPDIKEHIISFYIDYVNNFLTIASMADYYHMSDSKVKELIELGRKYHFENM